MGEAALAVFISGSLKAGLKAGSTPSLRARVFWASRPVRYSMYFQVASGFLLVALIERFQLPSDPAGFLPAAASTGIAPHLPFDLASGFSKSEMAVAKARAKTALP